MRFFGLGGNGPYMAFDRRLPNNRSDVLASSRYQIVPSPRGLPMAQVTLNFRRDRPMIMNPHMNLTVLLDRSGSMQAAFAEGHVYNVMMAIYNYIAWSGMGLNLVFYDDNIWDAGHMQSPSDIMTAIANHGPRGGTYVMASLQHAVAKYGTNQGQGMYIIVITDGEFADKPQLQNYVINTMLPQVTPENPYAFRIHFVGAGEGVDHEFLRQIEADAAGKGVPLISQHHHAHLSHSHASIMDEMDRALIGVGINGQFGEPAMLGSAVPNHSPVITHTSNTLTRRVWDGPKGDIGFVPRSVTLGCEYSHEHLQSLAVGLQYQDPRNQLHQVMVSIPLPKEAPAATGQAGLPKFSLHLPWTDHSPEKEAERIKAAADREELKQRAEMNREAEMRRLQRDMQALARGGIPTQAEERLKEIANASGDEGVLFTSNLDPDELVLLRGAGYMPLGMVTGSAMYHVGSAYASTQGDCEVQVLSEAYNEATRLAVSRLALELKHIGAHGVVGVRLSLVRHEWADQTIEVQAIGTAVRGPGKAPETPWMCDLAGQEWYALHRAGYDCVGLVWGHATWFVLTTQADVMYEQSGYNVEIAHFSYALSSARHLAMRHLWEQSKELGATGVTGVHVERRLDEVRIVGYEGEHHNLVLSIIGTAIRVRPGAPTAVRATKTVLSLRDGRLTPVGMGLGDIEVE